MQDAALGWLRGDDFPPPPAALYLSLHNSSTADLSDEVSATVGGRVQVGPDGFSTARWLNGVVGGTREIVNSRAVVFDVASAEIEVFTFVIWDAPTGGTPLLKGVVSPSAVIVEGDPAVFLSGSLSIQVD
jgi:hypothetical protein